MATTYPGTIDSFTNPNGTNTLDDPDHADQHSSANDAIEAIEAVVGTTAGTSVLMDFSAGEFPVRQEGGTVSPGTLTLDSPTLGTPAITGGTATGLTLAGTPVLDSTSAIPFYNDSLHRQAIINGNFVVNQRVYVSNATLSAGSYGHDRWKAGASGGDYTFTQLPSSTQITIKSGKSLIQVVEDKNVVGGTYTLSWEGTAQARFGIDSATPSGSYASSPITITTQTAGTVMSVEFNEGTLGKVQLNSGSVALPFQPKSYEQELADCERYCKGLILGAAIFSPGFGWAQSTTAARIMIPLTTPMRITPSLTATASDWQLADSVGVGLDVTSIAMSVDPYSISSTCIYLLVQVASGLTQYRPYALRADAGGVRTMIFSAEL